MNAENGKVALPHIFEEVSWAGFKLRNRVKYGACCVSNFNHRDGRISARELARTRIIANTGCGMITNQGAYADPRGEGKAYLRQVAIYDDKFLAEFEAIAGYIHDAGAVAIQQILHAGRYGGIDLGYAVQPSAVPQTLPHFRPTREMSKDEIARCVREHADAARRAVKVGFDGTEVTSFMGYLLANFNSKFTNRRSDEYGGSVKNRARFMLEIIDAVKQELPDHPFIIRLSGLELMDRWGGNTEEECFELMGLAAEAGVDMISVTVGWQEAPQSSIGRDVEPGHWTYLARKAKELLPDTPIAFGPRLADPVMANARLGDGSFDFWEVCRPMLADPELLLKAAEGRLDENRRCIGTLHCLSRMMRDLPYECVMNPALGHEVEPQYAITPAVVKKRVLVVGAGPAGMECAITARLRGHHVTVMEKSSAIGGNFRHYARHDIANSEDLLSVIRYYERMVTKLGIEVKLNTECSGKLLRGTPDAYDVAVIATGGCFNNPNKIEGGCEGSVYDAYQIAGGEVECGQRVVVLGGGKIGLVLAESLRMKGHDVTIVEREKRLAGDVNPTMKWRHIAWMESLSINCYTGASVLKISSGAVKILTAQKDELIVEADTIINAGGMTGRQELLFDLEWLVDEVHGCGDALVPKGLKHAIHEGYRLGVRV